MKEYPLLTICLLTHNCEDFLEKTLNSLLSQTYPNFELLVSDNQSADRTIEIIKSFQVRNPKIIFRKNIPKIIPGKIYDGCYDNSNGCLRSGLINGELVAFCHGDDIYEKDFAEKEAEFLINNHQAGAVFSCANIIDKKDKKIRKLGLPKELKEKNLYNFMDIFKALLIHGNSFLQTLTFMARKEVFEKIGFFDEERFSTSRDLNMWLRILKRYPVGILENVLVNWRTEKGMVKSQYLCTKRADFFNVMDYYLDSKNLRQKFEKKCLRQYEYQKRFNNMIRAINFLIKGEKNKADQLLKEPFPYSRFLAFLQSSNPRKTKAALLRLIMRIGIVLGLDKPLGKILYRLRYGK